VHSDAVVGFVHVDAERLGIFKLSVHRSHRGNGHGRKLMKEPEEYCKSIGWKTAELGVFESRYDLVTYYKKQGYAPTDEIRRMEGAADGTEGLRVLSKDL
jgi:GNAT superfamily N-acetyltransferase